MFSEAVSFIKAFLSWVRLSASERLVASRSASESRLKSAAILPRSDQWYCFLVTRQEVNRRGEQANSSRFLLFMIQIV